MKKGSDRETKGDLNKETTTKRRGDERGHEGLSELSVVLEVDLPDGETLLVEVLVQPGDGTSSGVLVGVHSLPVLQVEGGLGEGVKGVLAGRLVSVGLLLLLLVSGLLGLLSLRGLGGSLSLGGLGGGILLGGSVGRNLSDEGNVREGRGDLGVVDHASVGRGKCQFIMI